MQDRTSTDVDAAVVRLAEALALEPPPPGRLSIPVFSRGLLEVRLYTPEGEDAQTPHERDEVYVVVKGTARFFDGAAMSDVGVDSFLFVAAGQPHRFESDGERKRCWRSSVGKRFR